MFYMQQTQNHLDLFINYLKNIAEVYRLLIKLYNIKKKIIIYQLTKQPPAKDGVQGK